MRVTTTFHFVAERNSRVPPVAEYCTAVALALADVSTFDATLVVGLTRHALVWVTAGLAVLP